MRKAILLTIGFVLGATAIPASAAEWAGKGTYFNSAGNCESALNRVRREAARSGNEDQMLRAEAAYCTREGGPGAFYILYPY